MRFSSLAVAFLALCEHARSQSAAPSAMDSGDPSDLASANPSAGPSGLPTMTLSASPSLNFTMSPSSAPSSMPTAPTTMAPTPACYDTFDLVHARERTFPLGYDRVRRYIMCPDTEYRIGQATPDGALGGQEAIQLRRNAHILCGTDGSRDNNCILTGGSFHLIVFQGFYDEYVDNALVSGFTFQGAEMFNMFLAGPGNITFVDCVVEATQNQAPVFMNNNILFGGGRRLQEGEQNLNPWESFLNYVDLVVTGKEEEMTKELALEDRRNLQFTSIGHMTTHFIDCLFVDNYQAVSASGINPGVVTARWPNNEIIMRSSVFRNNTYGDPAKGPLGYGISTFSDIELSNVCFIDNDFLLNGAVQVYDAAVVANHNYGTLDDGLACQFIAFFEGNSTAQCIDYDLDQCDLTPPTAAPTPQPTPPPTTTPAPTTSPAPSAQPTPPPTPSPTPPPVAQPTPPPVTPPPTPDSAAPGDLLKLKTFVVALAGALYFLL